MKHMLLSTAAVCGFLLLGACGDSTPETPPAGSVSQVEETVIAEETVSSDCKDEQPPLPDSGICHNAAYNYLEMPEDYQAAPLPDETCQWVVSEATMVENVLLFLVPQCGDVTSEIGVAPGARRAEMEVLTSAIGNTQADGASEDGTSAVIAAIYTTLEGMTPEESILKRAELDATENGDSFEGCEIHTGMMGGDSIVVALPQAEMDTLAEEGPVSVCGPLGLTDGGVNYWRVLSDEYLLFVNTTGDLWQDIDFNTITLLTPDGNGGWVQAGAAQ